MKTVGKTITRERLEALANAEYCKSNPGAWLLGLKEVNELARMALAAMESEPVAYSLIFRNMDGALNNHINTNTTFATREKAEAYGKGGKYEMRSDGRLEWVPNTALDPVVVPLYRHAQQPVVPDAIPVSRDIDAGYLSGWIDCRAAMLASSAQLPGSEPATVPGKWIPVSEQIPPSRHEVLVGRWWGEKPRWYCKWATYIPGHPDSQSSGWLIPGGSWTPTHWMELTAGPKEVKGE